MATLQEQQTWFDSWRNSLGHERLKERPVAYFCAEFALEQDIPTYSGGLGVLAGDVIREAGDRGVPMVGVGLFYRQGYACPTKLVGEEEIEACVDVDPQAVGLEPVLGANGERLQIKVPIQDRHVTVVAWKWSRGGVDVYLLDTQAEGNTAADRKITERLYVADKEARLKQELVLGVGGLRLLEALNIHPSFYHLNEGHSAMLGLELIRHEMDERGLGFDEAKQFARRRVVLTNHTLVAAGQETYSDDLAALLLTKYAQELGIPVSKVLEVGLVQESSTFSLTMLALRLSGIVNAVSRLHAQKAKEIWRDHPMVPVTNGIHLPTWDRIGDVGKDRGAMWAGHQKQKERLLSHISKETGRKWGKDELLLGWARRIVSYKRPFAILEDAGRFAKIARRLGRPVRLVFSGRPHPGDADGKAMLRKLREMVDGELKDVAAFLPDYGLENAAMLTAGCDVWLNTPIVGYEACGTSGMKAALNGTLPLTTKDGWVFEAEMFRVGWLLDSDHIASDIHDVLERDVVTTYYDRGTDGVPEHWEECMRNARDMVQNQFSATRMLRNYVDTLYA